MTPTYTPEQVALHNKEDDCWIIVQDNVLDVTKFLSVHPGGRKPILGKAGQDATKEFQMFHSPEILKKHLPLLKIGVVGSTAAAVATPATPIASATEEAEAEEEEEGGDSKQQKQLFGDLVPYGDPTWYQGWNSPYFKETHYRFRDSVRQCIERDLLPYVTEWDENKTIPREMFVRAYEAGWLAGVIGPPWPSKFIGSKISGGVKAEEFDAFHELILIDELSRAGSGGVMWGLFGGISIGLPPIMQFASKALQTKVVKDVLTGQKVICLCITEPAAGSDVANITTRAEKTPDGKFYVVNGEKKFITNGIYADFFTVAVRTGPPGSGMNGISLLLLEKGMPGLKTRRMEMQGVWSSGTTYITFEDVRVPVENLIGKENQGFKYIMFNFNHERWCGTSQCLRFARICYEEAFKYAHKRKTFGKRLVDHPVIRTKLSNMARQIEASQAWLENITYQITTMRHDEAMQKLGGPIALLKSHVTMLFETCAREASQIFGGLAYTRGGQAEKVERLYREVRAYAFGGGSEEILLDFGARRASQQWELQSKM